jgi:heat shock protein HslJ
MQKQQITTATAATAVTALALFTLAACGTESGTGSGDASVRESPLTGVRWNVESVSVDGRRTAGVAGTVLEIGSQDKATLSTGCDEYTADVTVEGDTVTVDRKTKTVVASCVMNLDALDKALDEAFTGRLTSKLSGDRLTLTSADGDVLALTSGPPPPLTGTRWTVNSLASDGSAARLPKGTDGKAYFTLEEDGSIQGKFGCNSFRGSAKISGDTITFGRLISTKMLCLGPEMTVERHTMKILDGKVTYDLNYGGLWLTAADGGLAALPDHPAPDSR